MFSDIKKLKEIFTRNEQLQLIGLLVAIIVMSFLQTLGIASVLPFISLIMEPNLVFENYWLKMVYDFFNFTSIRSFIVFTGLVMLFLIIISNVFSAFATWLKIKFGLLLNHRLSKRLLERYLYMPYTFFLNRNSADLINKILGEVSQLTSNYITPMLSLITKSLVSIFIFSLLLLGDVQVSLMALTLLGGTYAFILWRVNRSLSYRGTVQAEVAQLRFKALSESIGGIKEVKVVNRERYFIDTYSKHSLKLAYLASWHQVIAQVPRFILEAVAFGGIIVFVLFLLLTQQDARQVIPLASLFAFAGYRLLPALSEIFHSITTIKYTQAILDRVHRDITAGPILEIADEKQTLEIKNNHKFEKEIKLNNISYIYPNAQKNILENINLTIKHNSSVAFVGPTGSGKTTLVDIILGLLTPQKGAVLIDGVALSADNIKAWQSSLGYVPQHIYLIDDTIARNIAFGYPDNEIDFKAIELAAQIANIDCFINEELPEKYNTIVGERGIRLSGGQRQRLGIARALYHDPSILIFDEATSALDGTTEDAVLDALENAALQKTLIVVAHRLTTVIKCDHIYLIDKGCIIADGSYQELATKNAQFIKMAKLFSK